MATNRLDVLHQLQTPETDTSKVLSPDGAGGVQWGTGGGGGGGTIHEVVMVSGVTPPDPVLNSDGDDWVYSS